METTLRDTGRRSWNSNFYQEIGSSAERCTALVSTDFRVTAPTSFKSAQDHQYVMFSSASTVNFGITHRYDWSPILDWFHTFYHHWNLCAKKQFHRLQRHSPLSTKYNYIPVMKKETHSYIGYIKRTTTLSRRLTNHMSVQNGIRTYINDYKRRHFL